MVFDNESNGLFLSVVLHLISSGPFGLHFPTYLVITTAFPIQIPSTKWRASDNC